MVNSVAKCLACISFVGQIGTEALLNAVYQTLWQWFMVYGLSHDLAQFSMELECLLTVNAAAKMSRKEFEFFGGKLTIEKSFEVFKGFAAIGHVLVSLSGG